MYATGFNVYRSFNDCVLLDETMRQGREEAELLSQLLRIRTGHATQGDWQQLLGRLESRQTEGFMREFYSRSNRAVCLDRARATRARPCPCIVYAHMDMVYLLAPTPLYMDMVYLLAPTPL
jgi:hypothetical protein|tara:strand:+ start:918 stop:1280 length:363 start_codon:yes stop_codon:yes gene_type:complete